MVKGSVHSLNSTAAHQMRAGEGGVLTHTSVSRLGVGLTASGPGRPQDVGVVGVGVGVGVGVVSCATPHVGEVR